MEENVWIGKQNKPKMHAAWSWRCWGGGRIENSKKIYKESGAFSVHMGDKTLIHTHLHTYVYTKYLLNNKTDSKRQIYLISFFIVTNLSYSPHAILCLYVFILWTRTHIYTPVYIATRHKMTKAKTLEKKKKTNTATQ